MMCRVEPSKKSCWKSNYVCEITCNRLPPSESDMLPTYIGETSQRPSTGGSQHLTLQKEKEKMETHLRIPCRSNWTIVSQNGASVSVQTLAKYVEFYRKLFIYKVFLCIDVPDCFHTVSFYSLLHIQLNH